MTVHNNELSEAHDALNRMRRDFESGTGYPITAELRRTPVAQFLAAQAALGIGATIQTSNLSEDQIAERDRIESERLNETRRVRRHRERLAQKGRSK